MYTDIILLLVGAICTLLALSLIVYLFISKKRSRAYRELLQQETELFDAIATTAMLTLDRSKAITDDKTALLSAAQNAHPNEAAPHSGSGNTTVLLTDADRTALLREEQAETIDFDASALEGRYILRREIHGGGMSRVFLADSAKLGNQWIVKFISNRNGMLANEENILKLLNHISLPKIIDIFHDDKGVYIVQSFIEGVSLDKVLASGQELNQTIIMEWAEQLVQVLGYLHRMEPHPIYHFDLKPSNVMVTHDNRLVLIDFGISKRFGEDSAAAVGITYRYAAPEQFKHQIPDRYMPLIAERFGQMPAELFHKTPDARSDIFSLGVILFELATRQIPTVHNMNMLKESVSRELFDIIGKCLHIDPSLRYQSASELLLDLQKVKGSKIKMARTLFMRKLASVTAAFAIVASGGSLTSGYYLYGQEAAAVLDVRPEVVTISLQQSSDLAVEKHMPNGDTVFLDNSQIRWEFSRDSVVRIDGNRISGMNVGETELFGRYRNKDISLSIRVVEPIEGMVDISQRYQLGRIVSVYAGTAERDHRDGALAEAEFVSPESIAIAEDGTVYVADSGVLRIIRGGYVESIGFEPSYLTPRLVRCYGDDVYILTDPWQDDDGYYYGLIKLGFGGAEGLYVADARYTAIEDFALSRDGLLYFIDRNEGLGATYLKALDPANVGDIQVLCELPKGTLSLAIGERGAVYLANPETVAIQVWNGYELSYFAGVENEKAFIDGYAPLFYMPQNIKYSDGYLYVWDFNVLRRITVADGMAEECITVAGEASPVFDMEISRTRQAAEDIILPNSRLMDFVDTEDGILLTDPKRGVIWRVNGG